MEVAELALGEVNLDGDGQADLTVHGGPDKAVYFYPAEHYAGWRAEEFALSPGGVGENVSVTGALETEVRVGDRWEWGDAVVEATTPRAPCFKFGMHVRKQAIAAMVNSGRCGWYLRVLRVGTVPTSGRLRLVDRHPGAPTIAELFRQSFVAPADLDEDVLRRAIATPALPRGWREGLERKLGRVR